MFLAVMIAQVVSYNEVIFEWRPLSRITHSTPRALRAEAERSPSCGEFMG
ncbi:MAG: hypothetical protein ACJA00_002741 [Myxococcota bacterium]|jgi:hypothetical protein